MRIKSNRSPPSILRHPVPVIQVVTDQTRLLLVQKIGIRSVGSASNRQQSVDDYIGISPDRRREMSVQGHGQAVVEKVVFLQHPAGKVNGLHHAACGQYAQHYVHVGIVGVYGGV